MLFLKYTILILLSYLVFCLLLFIIAELVREIKIIFLFIFRKERSIKLSIQLFKDMFPIFKLLIFRFFIPIENLILFIRYKDFVAKLRFVVFISKEYHLYNINEEEDEEEEEENIIELNSNDIKVINENESEL